MLRGFKLGAAIAISAAVAGCGAVDFGFLSPSPSPTPEPASSFRVLPPDPLIGKWGVATFHSPNERAGAEKQARQRCASPYVIVKGSTDGVMMHIPEDPDAHELALKRAADGKTYVGFNAPIGDANDREIIEQTSKVLVMRFVDPDKASRYGTSIYVKC